MSTADLPARDVDAELLALAHALADPDHPTKRATSAWASEQLGQHDRVAADLNASFPASDWAVCADEGIFRLTVPDSLGGSGADLATVLLTLEGLGLGCRDNGLTYAIASQLFSTQEALVRFGSPDQQDRWLHPLMNGAVLASFALTEPEVGSDAYTLSTRAERTTSGDYVLNGHKAFITFASRCDMVIVFASTAPQAGQWGLSAFIVPTDLEGVERHPNRDKMGMRTTPFSDITLTDVVVPASALLGRAGAGASIFNAVVQVERAFVFATQVGAMERHLQDSLKFAREREQGGGPIGGHQVIAHRLVDMKLHHETARLFVYRAAMAMATGRDFPMAAALAKLVGSDAGISSALCASSIHGARGYVSEYEVERNLRDAIGGLVYSGTSDIQRNIVARLLGVGRT